MPTNELNDLQRRIVGALQVDGRAPWRRIAEVLGEPERSVTRVGTDLLERGIIGVAAVQHSGQQLILACESAPGTARLSSEALAQRDDVTFSYLTTGGFDVVAEIGYRDNLSELLTLQLPATAGLVRVLSFPVLKYFKTIRGWRCGALTQAEEEALTPRTGPDRTEWTLPDTRGPNDDTIVDALREDGRTTIGAIARRVKMSETSVARRVEWLLGSGQFSIRTVVDPVIVGLPVEAMLWVQAPTHLVEPLGRALRAWPEVRYAVAIAGEYQLLVDVTAVSHAQLYRVLSHGVWAEHSTRVRADFVFEARKRGGRLMPVAS